jgi:hypothetical protein
MVLVRTQALSWGRRKFVKSKGRSPIFFLCGLTEKFQRCLDLILQTNFHVRCAKTCRVFLSDLLFCGNAKLEGPTTSCPQSLVAKSLESSSPQTATIGGPLVTIGTSGSGFR